MDGVAPYTYSEEQPACRCQHLRTLARAIPTCACGSRQYDDLLQQHTPGVQTRTEERPVVVIAALPREDSPSAARYVAEREGETAWTMHLDADELVLPMQVQQQLTQRDNVNLQFDPKARADDQDGPEPLPANYVPPRLDE